MTVEEKAAHDALLLEVKSIVTSAMGETVEKKSFNEAIEKINALEKKESVSQADFDAIKAEHITAMVELKALKESATSKKTELKHSLEEALEANKDSLKSLMDRKEVKGVSLEFKAVANMGTGNVTPTTAGGVTVLLNDVEAGISGFSRSRPFFSTLFPTSPTVGNTVSYAEMVTPEGGAGMTAEGALKSQADFNLAEKQVNIRKVTAYIKTSKESLADIPALAGEINAELVSLVELKADSQILSGDGTGQNLTGIISVATAFAAGDFADALTLANEYDVINVAINQIEVAEVISGEPAGFMPNVIVMNPTDIKKMKLTKSSTGEYVFNTTEGPQIGTQIDNITVLSNPRMTKGYFLVMDSTKGTVRIRENTKIDFGYENDDYTKNLVTILAEKRLAFYIKSQNVKAFVYGNFATAKAAIQI